MSVPDNSPVTDLSDLGSEVAIKIFKLADVFAGCMAQEQVDKPIVMFEVFLFFIHHIFATSPRLNPETPVLVESFSRTFSEALGKTRNDYDAKASQSIIEKYNNLKLTIQGQQNYFDATLDLLFRRIEKMTGNKVSTVIAQPELIKKHIEEENAFVAGFDEIAKRQQNLVEELQAGLAEGKITQDEFQALSRGVHEHVDDPGWDLNSEYELVFSRAAKLNPSCEKCYRVSRKGEWSSIRLGSMEDFTPTEPLRSFHDIQPSSRGCLFVLLSIFGVPSVIYTINSFIR